LPLIKSTDECRFGVAGERRNAGDPKGRLTNLMVHYANLRDIRNGHCTFDDVLGFPWGSSRKLQALALQRPTPMAYKTTAVNNDSEMIYDHRFESYATACNST